MPFPAVDLKPVIMARLNLSILAACLSLSVLTSALPAKRFDPMEDSDLDTSNPAEIAEMSLRVSCTWENHPFTTGVG